MPSFSASVHGLSSYSAYPVPMSISHNMELSLKIMPSVMDQISLILFLGQHGVHDSSADHMAISFVKGYIMLTWNLGSGNVFTYISKNQMNHLFFRRTKKDIYHKAY